MARPSKLWLHESGQWASTIGGKRLYFGTDRRKALRAFHQRLGKTPLTEAGGTRLVADLIRDWLALYGSKCHTEWLTPLMKWGGDEHAEDIEADFLTRYLIHLRGYTFTRGKDPTKRALSPKTMRHYIQTARKVLAWAVKQRWVSAMPDVPELPRAVRKARDIDPDERDRILGELPERAGRILRFIAATGCRPSEACRLEWKHVRLDAGCCILDEHKTAASTGKVRTIYLTPDAAGILRKLKPTIGPVFTSRTGEAYSPKGLRSILRRRGINGAYALRHTFAQQVSEQVTPDVLAKLLGHGSDATTAKHYYEVRDARAVAVAATIKLHKPPAAGLAVS